MNADKGIFIKDKEKSIRVRPSDIMWISAWDNYVIIFTNQDKFTVRITMRDISNLLPSNDFVRIHRSYIVNLDRIDEIDHNHIIIAGERIPVSRSNKHVLKRHLNFV